MAASTQLSDALASSEMAGVSEQTSELPAGKTCGRAARGTHAR
jgi:hypothetical protein